MSDLSSAIKNICEEKGLSYEAVISTIEQALAAAYRKDFGQKNQNVKVKFNPEDAKSKVFDVKTVVEDMPPEEPSAAEAIEGEKVEVRSKKLEGNDKDDKPSRLVAQVGGQSSQLATQVGGQGGFEDREEVAEEEERRFNPKLEIQLSDAKLLKKTAKIGDEIKTKLEVPEAYGRMAAQTAKQVIIQRLREAEREMIFTEFKDKEKEVVSGIVQRRENRVVLVDLGKVVGVIPAEEQIPGENYNSGERIKVFIKEVRFGSKGAEVILSRISDEILKKVFYLEIPEISNGLVELKAVAREAGSRSKVAVFSDSENVDPIGSCVGQRGARIQTIINELGGEKIDIILYDEISEKFIANALSPAKISSISINKFDKDNSGQIGLARGKAIVKVSPDQLSLAIGKGGQNARLAARLTGWKIDIVGEEEKDENTEQGEKVEVRSKKLEGNDKDDKPSQPATQVGGQGKKTKKHENKEEDKETKEKKGEKDEKVKKSENKKKETKDKKVKLDKKEDKKTQKQEDVGTKKQEDKEGDTKSKNEDKAEKKSKSTAKLETDDKDDKKTRKHENTKTQKHENKEEDGKKQESKKTQKQEDVEIEKQENVEEDKKSKSTAKLETDDKDDKPSRLAVQAGGQSSQPATQVGGQKGGKKAEKSKDDKKN